MPASLRTREWREEKGPRGKSRDQQPGLGRALQRGGSRLAERARGRANQGSPRDQSTFEDSLNPAPCPVPFALAWTPLPPVSWGDRPSPACLPSSCLPGFILFATKCNTAHFLLLKSAVLRPKPHILTPAFRTCPYSALQPPPLSCSSRSSNSTPPLPLGLTESCPPI